MNGHSSFNGAKSIASWLPLWALEDADTAVLVLQGTLHFLSGGEGGRIGKVGLIIKREHTNGHGYVLKNSICYCSILYMYYQQVFFFFKNRNVGLMT